MIKICTSLEQSKKLLELGIDVYTADMFWKNGVSDKYIQCFTPFVNSGTNIDYDYDIPAWGLSSLLILTPNEILINDEYYYLNLNKTKIEYRGPVTFDGQKFKSFECNNLVDAAFEMVVWLKENGIL